MDAIDTIEAQIEQQVGFDVEVESCCVARSEDEYVAAVLKLGRNPDYKVPGRLSLELDVVR